MKQRLKIDMQHLYKLAKSGKSAEEMMRELDIEDMADLKNALINLMHEEGEDILIPGLHDKASVTPRYTEEGIRINPEMVSGAEFKTGVEFSLTVEGDRITLKKKA